MFHLKYLNKFLWKHRSLLIIGAFFILISNIFALYPAEFVRKALDSAVENISTNQNRNAKLILLKYSSLIIIFSIIKGIFMYFMRQTIIVMSRRIEYDLKNEIYKKYQMLSVAFYKKNKAGDLMNRISEDVTRVRMYLGPALMYTINISILFYLVLTKMFSINAHLTYYVLIPLPILAISVYFVSKNINIRSEKTLEELSRLTTISQETYSGIKIIKSFNNEMNLFSKFVKHCKKYTNKQLYLVKIEAFFFPLIITLIGTSTILTIYIGGLEVIEGNLSSGNIAEFIIYVNMLSWPVASVGWITSIIQRAAASQKRINEFLQTDNEIKNYTNKSENISGNIQFENVTLKYQNTNITAIKNINFIINEKEHIGIFGKTGSGKSTIINLICRLYDPTEGKIYIGNENIKKLNLYNLRKKIGYIPQDDYLFSGSIKENITFSSDNFNEENLLESTYNAELQEDINNFNNKFNTIIGERGVQLSGGQKQRLAIARTFYKKPDIFIFDDCLSAVDAKKEHKIINKLKIACKEKTCIIVSHRIESLKNLDKIYVIDNSKMIESGNHEQLLKKRGLYYKMFLIQKKKKFD